MLRDRRLPELLLHRRRASGALGLDTLYPESARAAGVHDSAFAVIRPGTLRNRFRIRGPRSVQRIPQLLQSIRARLPRGYRKRTGLVERAPVRLRHDSAVYQSAGGKRAYQPPESATERGEPAPAQERGRAGTPHGDPGTQPSGARNPRHAGAHADGYRHGHGGGQRDFRRRAGGGQAPYRDSTQDGERRPRRRAAFD